MVPLSGSFCYSVKGLTNGQSSFFGSTMIRQMQTFRIVFKVLGEYQVSSDTYFWRHIDHTDHIDSSGPLGWWYWTSMRIYIICSPCGWDVVVGTTDIDR